MPRPPPTPPCGTLARMYIAVISVLFLYHHSPYPRTRTICRGTAVIVCAMMRRGGAMRPMPSVCARLCLRRRHCWHLYGVSYSMRIVLGPDVPLYPGFRVCTMRIGTLICCIMNSFPFVGVAVRARVVCADASGCVVCVCVCTRK